MAAREIRTRPGAMKQPELWYEINGEWHTVLGWSVMSGRPVRTINSRVDAWLRSDRELSDEFLHAAVHLSPAEWPAYRLEATAAYVPPEPERAELSFLLRLAHGCPSAIREARGE